MEIRDVLDRHAKNKNEEKNYLFDMHVHTQTHERIHARTNSFKTNKSTHRERETVWQRAYEHDAIATNEARYLLCLNYKMNKNGASRAHADTHSSCR